MFAMHECSALATALRYHRHDRLKEEPGTTGQLCPSHGTDGVHRNLWQSKANHDRPLHSSAIAGYSIRRRSWHWNGRPLPRPLWVHRDLAGSVRPPIYSQWTRQPLSREGWNGYEDCQVKPKDELDEYETWVDEKSRKLREILATPEAAAIIAAGRDLTKVEKDYMRLRDSIKSSLPDPPATFIERRLEDVFEIACLPKKDHLHTRSV
ncbi:hypothetical protein N7541_003746 [Penicillium brevicompactum]|uniref:Uncharacterized protein n=1 Tax=Penicillium brevicompactum TaxID=5074 RepID=A0A9W9RMF3_PENBR|nr:hypothetical protein N7541_003746 [Penicillium brevicompactum]